MKKIIAALAAGALSLTALAACSTSDTEAAEDGDFKVGLSIYSTTDATSKPVYDMAKRATEAMGGELVLAIDDLDQDKQISQIENLIASGVDAVLFLPYSDDAVPTIARMAEESEVLWGMYWHKLGSDEQVAMESPYFIGNTYEDDVWSAYTAMKTLHEAGAKNIGFFGLPKGRETTELRDQGIQQAVDEFGMQILVEDRENVNDASDAAASLESFIASYPEMDGVVIAGMTQIVLPGVVQTLSKLDLTDEIAVSAIDFNDNQTEYYQDGALQGIIGGHSAGPAYLVSLIANQLNDTPLADEPVSIQDNFIVLESLEDALAYDEHVATNLAYSEEEAASWSRANNPDFSLDELLEVVQAYSLEDILERQGVTE